ncbi:chaperone modulator CbpM [Variovorax sp. KK3]|uniref:chaperone modulator CbpM n=1 Tax=Variovorax sp. KK3 TaxID=1855728 RepID=UPI00097C96C1|nr:chaperone modulator CbpM [Variovorax sp. KK3]
MTRPSYDSTALGSAHPLRAHELAHACGAEVGWVVQLVEVGIVEVRTPAERPDDWCFHSADLQCALDARRLERDFGVGLDAAALILDLEHEVRRLKALMSARGLGREI